MKYNSRMKKSASTTFIDHRKNAQRLARAKDYHDNKEILNKNSNDEQLELMTQFMLDPTSSATTLLEKRREMYELQEALQKDKEKFREKEMQFKKTEEELRGRDEDFHKQICDYYRNIYEKTQNGVKYDNKAQEEANDIKLLNDKKVALNDKYIKQQKDIEKLNKIKRKLEVYATFLGSVRDKYPDKFVDINSIMDTFHNLEKNYQNIKDSIEEKKKEREKENKKFKDEKTTLEKKINKKVTEINRLQEDLKILKEQKKNLENDTAAMEANSNTIVSSLETILLAVNNIYQKCTKKSWTTHGDAEDLRASYDQTTDYAVKVSDAKKKIGYIKKYLMDYQIIYEDYKEAKANKDKGKR